MLWLIFHDFDSHICEAASHPSSSASRVTVRNSLSKNVILICQTLFLCQMFPAVSLPWAISTGIGALLTVHKSPLIEPQDFIFLLYPLTA